MKRRNDHPFNDEETKTVILEQLEIRLEPRDIEK